MRTIWRILVRTIFWSFERGTWPYDVAVALIVIFVLLSPRSWFHDRPADGPRSPALIRVPEAVSPGGMVTYRIPARALDPAVRGRESDLEMGLEEAVRRNVKSLDHGHFQIVRIEPVRGKRGAVDYYDVSVKP